MVSPWTKKGYISKQDGWLSHLHGVCCWLLRMCDIFGFGTEWLFMVLTEKKWFLCIFCIVPNNLTTTTRSQDDEPNNPFTPPCSLFRLLCSDFHPLRRWRQQAKHAFFNFFISACKYGKVIYKDDLVTRRSQLFLQIHQVMRPQGGVAPELCLKLRNIRKLRISTL